MNKTNFDWLNSLSKEEASEAYWEKWVSLRNELTSYDTPLAMLSWLSCENYAYIKPTEEEFKAIKMAVAMGMPFIARRDNSVYGAYVEALADTEDCPAISCCDVPALKILRDATWITDTPLDLRNLL